MSTPESASPTRRGAHGAGAHPATGFLCSRRAEDELAHGAVATASELAGGDELHIHHEPLALAPGMDLAREARWADLDAPLVLARRREHGRRFEGSLVLRRSHAVWGRGASAAPASSEAPRWLLPLPWLPPWA